MYSTTATERWVVKKYSLNEPVTREVDYQIYSDSLLQEITGFGGTFNEKGWDALLHLTQEGRERVMKSLFAEDGVHFL